MANDFTDKHKKRLPANGDLNWADEVRENTILDEIMGAARDRQNYVVSGVVASDGGGLQVDYTSGSVYVDGATQTITASNKTAVDDSSDRSVNYLYVDSAGVVQISQTAPTGEYVPIALVDVSSSVINRIGDLRAINAAGGSGTVTSVVAGDGLDFTTFTTTGSVTLGTPSSITNTSTNAKTTTSHTHAITSITASKVSDFDTEVGNNSTVTANTSARHTSGSDTSLGVMASDINMNGNSLTNSGDVNFDDNTLLIVPTAKWLGVQVGATIYYAFDDAALQPANTNVGKLGLSSKYWNECWATTYQDNGGGYNDTLDDLLILSEFKPRKIKTIDPDTNDEVEVSEIDPKNNSEFLDINSLPEWMTNRGEMEQRLRDECGEMISEDDIDSLLSDHNEAGWMVGRNVSAFNDLTSGAVRQLDNNMQLLFENTWGRIMQLEKEIKRLQEDKI